VSFAVGSSRKYNRFLCAAWPVVVVVAPDPTPSPVTPFPADHTGGPKRALPGRLNDS